MSTPIDRIATSAAPIIGQPAIPPTDLLLAYQRTTLLYAITLGQLTRNTNPLPFQDTTLTAAAKPALLIGTTGLAYAATNPDSTWALTIATSDGHTLAGTITSTGVLANTSHVPARYNPQAGTLHSLLTRVTPGTTLADDLLAGTPIPPPVMRPAATALCQLTHASTRHRLRRVHPNLGAYLKNPKP